MIGCFHEVFLKAGVDGHQLMDDVCHLHKLEIVFESRVAFACIFRFPDPQGIVNGTLDQTEDHFGTSFGVAKLLFGQVG